MLVNGTWTADWQPVQAKDAKGGFVRQTSSFRNWVTPDGAPGPTGEGGFAAEAGRYHLYVALICPWASRTLIGRKLKRLEEVVSVSVVEPALTDQGWRFGDYPGATRDVAVERCEVVSDRVREQIVDGYLVTYRLDGRNYTMQTDRHPGDWVQLAVDPRPAAYRVRY